MRSNNYSTNEVAELVGISKRTLLNWLYGQKVPEPKRNPNNNYRIWTDHDFRMAWEYKTSLTKYQALFKKKRGVHE